MQDEEEEEGDVPRGQTEEVHCIFIMLGIYFSTCFLIVYLFRLQEAEDEVEDEGEVPSF
jgi:hypothetical protein